MPHRSLALCLCIALAGVATPASAQRSLADRVTALEMRVATNDGNTSLVNQMLELKSAIQALQSRVEELQNENNELRDSLRARYLDIDGRLVRLEGGSAPAVAPAPVATPSMGATPATGATSPADTATRAAAGGIDTTPPDLPSDASAPGRARGDGEALPTGDERIAYDAAFEALKAGRYADATRLFGEFMDRFPGGVYAPNALYWLGESYYVSRDYRQALQQFEQLLDRFGTHDKAPGALLKVGLSHLNLDDPAAAEAAFNEVIARYPDSDVARLAENRLQSMRLRGLQSP